MFVMYLDEDAGLNGSKMLYSVGQNKASFAQFSFLRILSR